MTITQDSTVTDESVREYKIDIPQAQLDDLKTRLSLTRWPEKEPVTDWSQGVPLAEAKKLIDYWTNKYDWRATEARLNKHPQFITTIDGLDIHFLHIKSKHANALPMIMTHGWPGSILEFEKVIAPLTDPTNFGGTEADAFDVVIPSIPGHGFSGKPTVDGWGAEHTARAWATLMDRLGYDNWVASGGDWGSTVVHWLALQQPKGLVAGHSNWPLVFPKEAPTNPTDEEQKAFADVGRFVSNVAGYHHEQATRPQTLGYALADSPVGQAIWIFEKFNEWSDNPGPLSYSWGDEPREDSGTVYDVFPIDEVLDGITVYWLTNTGASSGRYYWENARGTVGTDLAFGRLELPMSGTVFPKDMYRAPRAWAEASWPNLVHWGIAEKGGHFAAWEQPEIITSELRASFGPQFRKNA